MKVEEMKNKEGETMTTEEGETLYKYKLEEGDELIPLFNSVLEKTNKGIDKEGKEVNITNYSIKAKVRDKEGTEYPKEVFVSLTPTQAASLTKKAESGTELTQNLFVCYKYTSDKYGDQLGIGLKNRKPPKSFEDFKDEEN